jgi:triphosphatase
MEEPASDGAPPSEGIREILPESFLPAAVVRAALDQGPRKARPIELSPRDSIEDAAAWVFSAALDHFEDNLPDFTLRQSVESVHQMRVGLRRLRAAIGLFRGAIDGQSLEAARDRAKNLASILGAARNWDVFLEMLAAGPARSLADDPSFQALEGAIEARRARAYLVAQKTLAGRKTAKFIGDLRKTIAARDWTRDAAATEPGSAREFAKTALTRLRKRALKKSRGLAGLTPDQRHEARIALKKARYGAEFFESLFSHRRDARDFSAALAKMQDGLGVFNDMEMANALLDEIDSHRGAKGAAHGGPGPLRASGFVRGWFAHAAREGAAHARKSEKRLKALEPFWMS